MKCWQVMKCGREEGGINAKELGVCPVYPDLGNSCARVVGTLCGGRVQGVFAAKHKDCRKCRFYNSLHYDHLDGDVNILVINEPKEVDLGSQTNDLARAVCECNEFLAGKLAVR